MLYRYFDFVSLVLVPHKAYHPLIDQSLSPSGSSEWSAHYLAGPAVSSHCGVPCDPFGARTPLLFGKVHLTDSIVLQPEPASDQVFLRENAEIQLPSCIEL